MGAVMSDEPLALPEGEQLPPELELVIDYIFDPHTAGWTFSAVSSRGAGMSVGQHTSTDPHDSDLHALAAVVLLDLAPHADQDQTEFIRSVVNEYNDRRENMEHGFVERDGF